MIKTTLYENLKEMSLYFGKASFTLMFFGVLLIPIHILNPLPTAAIKLYSTTILGLIFCSLWIAVAALVVRYGINIYTTGFSVFMLLLSVTFINRVIEVVSMMFR